MMIPPFDYEIPKTLEEACDLLWKSQGKARVIAGGTDLVVELRRGDPHPHCLIDITNIPELRTIEQQDGRIIIGAAVTHSEITSSPLVKGYGKVLSEAVSRIGSPQIRNLGTIGGNIVNASPAADTLPPLMVFDAVGKVVSKEGEKEVPLPGLFKGPYETVLKPQEILTQVAFNKLPAGVKSSFVRVARREAMAIARISVAVVFEMEDGNGRIKDVRIAVGSVTPTPQRILEAEATLKGKKPEEKWLKKASLKVSEAMLQQSGVRPSTSYKKPVIEALVVRAMRKALEERS